MEQAIRRRHAVRKYLPDPIPKEKIEALSGLVSEINAETPLNFALAVGEPDAFRKSLFAYGMFKNVRNYFVLAGPKTPETETLVGYHGEKLVLKAQELGLNTCWVGMSFSRRHSRIELAPGEKIHCAVALGYGETQGVQHKCKSPLEICPEYSSMPGWFQKGIGLALLAPTAMNQQKYHFTLVGKDKVRATTDSGAYTKVDLGIARLHFEIGAGKENFSWEDA